MSTVAEQLRQAREARNLSVQQIAQTTKIRADHLRALEEGNFDVFSAPIFIRGFVRTYATLLKLDVPQIMAALDAELGRTEKFSEPPPLTESKRGPLDYAMLQLSKVNWRRGLAGLGAAAAVVVVASLALSWWRYEARGQLRGLRPALYQPTNRNAGETLPVPPPNRR